MTSVLCKDLMVDIKQTNAGIMHRAENIGYML